MDNAKTPTAQMPVNNRLQPPGTSYRTLVTQLPSTYNNQNCATVNVAANKIAHRNFRSEQQPNRIASRLNSRHHQDSDGRDALDSVHKLQQSGLMNRLKLNYSSLKLSLTQYKPTQDPLPPRKSEQLLEQASEQQSELSTERPLERPPGQLPKRHEKSYIEEEMEDQHEQQQKQKHQQRQQNQQQQNMEIQEQQNQHHQQMQKQQQHQNQEMQHQQHQHHQEMHQQQLQQNQEMQQTLKNITNSRQQLNRTNSEPIVKYRVQVNKKVYQILKKIGCGGSSKVYEGFDPQTLQTVAIKIIDMALADPKTQDSYHNERLLLQKLSKSNRVVRMYDSEYKNETKELILVMEKGDADLAQVIDSYFEDQEDRLTIDYEFIKFHWKGMLRAVNDIHKHGVVHADLKPVNFIVVKNKLKLIDFGIANSIEPDHTSVVRDFQIGTINYMAPEALKNRASECHQVTSQKTLIKYNAKADIWSLGCILYNMVYGRPPFDKYPNLISKAQAIIDPNHKIEYPPISNCDLLDCIKLCLRYNPSERPTAEELLKHPYLTNEFYSSDHANNNSFPQMRLPRDPTMQSLISQISQFTPKRVKHMMELVRINNNREAP